MNEIPVWQMIKEAVENSENSFITNKEITEYISTHYQSVNPGTISCQIAVCTVNRPSRIQYPENNKPRICESRYDFLYSVGRGKVVRYCPSAHGFWQIKRSDDGELIVSQLFSPSPQIDDDPSAKDSIIQTVQFGKRFRETQVIPNPSPKEVNKYLAKWDQLENYYAQENALDLLFRTTYPRNIDINEVLIKVASVNEFYSTNIYSVYSVANHITNLHIDTRLIFGDPALVFDIAKVKQANGKIINFYSFATKYCSRHNPQAYPIFDNILVKILKHFRDTDGLICFANNDLNNYAKYKDVLLQFQRAYHLQEFDFKAIDKYLWQLGKEFLPIKY